MWGLIDMIMGTILKVSACLFAGFTGFSFVFWWKRSKLLRLQKQRVRMGYRESYDDAQAFSVATHGLPLRLIEFMRLRTQIVSLKPRQHIFRQRLWSLGLKGFDKIIPQTGISSTITKRGFIDARGWFCLAGLGSGALIGIVFSEELAVLLGFLGAVIGWKATLWALKQEREARKKDLENHLSEMLEVVALGLRSGLSFDRSFELYHAHFTNALGKSSASAQQQWQFGLASREATLRKLAASYDSPLFSRVVENIVRSLRFGSSLAESLEASALESRLTHKAYMEERVAKAPVKMLIPTAALILPAMLLLVLGPILLEMIQGF